MMTARNGTLRIASKLKTSEALRSPDCPRTDLTSAAGRIEKSGFRRFFQFQDGSVCPPPVCIKPQPLAPLFPPPLG